MAGSVNVVVLVGNLTRDPELRATGGGTSVCRLGVAVNERIKDPDDRRVGRASPTTSTSTCSAPRARAARSTSAKGRQVAVEGRLRWRSWETQEGQKRSAVSVVANNVQFIGPRDSGGQGGGWSGPSAGQGGQSGGAGFTGPGPEPSKGDFSESDDDIPF